MLRTQFCFCVLCAAIGLMLVLLLLAAPETAFAQPPAKPAAVSFINDVAPILKESCFACHDAKKRKGKLDMTTYESFRKGGDKDDPIVPGKPEDSLVIDLLTAKNTARMPPKELDPLPKEKVAVIQQWIKEGAKLDAGLTAKADLFRELRIRWKPPAPPATYLFPEKVTALAFTPDGKKLVIGGHHELLVWDIDGTKLEKRISIRAERALSMLFLPDGKLVVAGGRPGQEGDVKVYDINAKGAKMQNGVALLDGVNDKNILVKQLLDADEEVLCLALSPDGKKLASGGCDRLVNVWDLSGGFANAKLEQTIENHADWVFGVAFSPDGKHLLTASRDKTAKVWDLATKESVLTFPDHQQYVYGVAITADGKQGVSVGEDNQLRFWNATGEGKQVRASGGHGKAVFRVVANPKQPQFITCSADNTVRIWDAAKGNNIKTLNGNTDWVYAVTVSADGNLIASGSWNGEVRIWKATDGTQVKAFNASPGHQIAAAPPMKK
jgi:hypothetical protein